MEFTRINETFSPKKICDSNHLNEKYPTDLSMYLEPPTEQIDIEEFQEMAVERVKLLRVLEMSSLKSIKGMNFKEIVLNEMTKQNMKYFLPIVRGCADPETRRRDYLSHFILRLCYCQSEELRRWFLARESEFFRLKFFNMEKKDDIVLFMKKNKIYFAPITDEEKTLLASDLYCSTSRYINLELTDFYKVHFTQVLDLIRAKKIFLKSGNAFVPQMDLISILLSIFRMQLSHGLALCASNMPKLESDERLSKILRGLHISYTENDYCVNTKHHISKSDLEGLAVKSFPPCMRAMFETFKATHHLRYFARLQLGLFLKGIGVSLEDSLKFWKEGFTKKPDLDSDTFEKRYAYSIRHSYGTEGKRANYAPHNCLKIINTNVGPGDNHGCPFKHYDADSLKQKLLSYNLSVKDILVITDFAARGHYQLACTKYFEVTHSVTNAKGINHPNLYFEESQNVINEKETNKNSKMAVKSEIMKTNDKWANEKVCDLEAIETFNST